MNAFARVYMRPNTHIYTYHKDLRTFITFLLLNFTSSNFRAILFSLPFISPKSLQKQKKNAPINEKKAIFFKHSVEVPAIGKFNINFCHLSRNYTRTFYS